jgi:hypothetical protein
MAASRSPQPSLASVPATFLTALATASATGTQAPASVSPPSPAMAARSSPATPRSIAFLSQAIATASAASGIPAVFAMASSSKASSPTATTASLSAAPASASRLHGGLTAIARARELIRPPDSASHAMATGPAMSTRGSVSPRNPLPPGTGRIHAAAPAAHGPSLACL